MPVMFVDGSPNFMSASTSLPSSSVLKQDKACNDANEHKTIVRPRSRRALSIIPFNLPYLESHTILYSNCTCVCVHRLVGA